MTDRTELVQIVKELDEELDYDDVQNLTKEDLQEKYDLQVLPHDPPCYQDNAGVLYYIVQEGSSNPAYSTYHVPDENAKLYLQELQESVHNQYPGWSPEDQIIIRGYLADIAYSVQLGKEAESRIRQRQGE